MNIIEFPLGDLPDVAKMLRKLADDIDAGEYGAVDACAVVMTGFGLDVFGFGPNGNADRTIFLLEAGKAQLVSTLRSQYADS